MTGRRFLHSSQHTGVHRNYTDQDSRIIMHTSSVISYFSSHSTAFCTYPLGSHDTLRHCQRARACRCGGEKSRALRQGRVFQLFLQMALWDTLGSGMDQHFAPELFAGTSKTTTFYKLLTMTAGHGENAWNPWFLSMLQKCCGFDSEHSK